MGSSILAVTGEKRAKLPRVKLPIEQQAIGDRLQLRAAWAALSETSERITCKQHDDDTVSRFCARLHKLLPLLPFT